MAIRLPPAVVSTVASTLGEMRWSDTTKARASGIQLGLDSRQSTFTGVPPVVAITYTHGVEFSDAWNAIRVPSGDQDR